MNIRRAISMIAATGCLATAGAVAATPAHADVVESCYQVFNAYGDMCLFYNSGYGGSNTGFWKSGYIGSHTRTFTSDASAGYDHFYSSGNGQGQRLWHNMSSDENYNTYFTAVIYGANGATTNVPPVSSNNRGGNDYNIDENLTLYN
ncbi:MAG TPA: hypothetical protein VFU65_03980 [Actinocrinis sp.]|nr:hypothetical protein [Actinocrinis sp.]